MILFYSKQREKNQRKKYHVNQGDEKMKSGSDNFPPTTNETQFGPVFEQKSIFVISYAFHAFLPGFFRCFIYNTADNELKLRQSIVVFVLSLHLVTVCN